MLVKHQEIYIYRNIYQRLTYPPCCHPGTSNYSKTRVKVLRVYVSNNDIYYICIKIGKLGVIHEFPDGIVVREESPEFVIKQSQINSGIIKVFDI